MVKSPNLPMQQLRPVTLSVARLQSVYWMRLISFWTQFKQEVNSLVFPLSFGFSLNCISNYLQFEETLETLTPKLIHTYKIICMIILSWEFINHFWKSSNSTYISLRFWFLLIKYFLNIMNTGPVLFCHHLMNVLSSNLSTVFLFIDPSFLLRLFPFLRQELAPNLALALVRL